MSGFETAMNQPFAWGERAALFEIPLERGQTAPGIVGNLFHRYVIHVITLQKIQYVDFPRVKLRPVKSKTEAYRFLLVFE